MTFRITARFSDSLPNSPSLRFRRVQLHLNPKFGAKESMTTFVQRLIKLLVVILGFSMMSRAQVILTSGVKIAGGIQIGVGVTGSLPPTGMLSYNMQNSTVPVSTLGPWLASHFQLMVMPETAKNFTGYFSGNNVWASYFGGCCIYQNDSYNDIIAMAAANGFADPEGAFLHFKADYSNTDTYHGYDQFDMYEQHLASGYGDPIWATKGIFTLVGPTYTDRTVDAYCPNSLTAACNTHAVHTITLSDRILIGDQIPFDVVNLTLTTPGVGCKITWQEWNGSAFATVTPASDTTNGLTTTGTVTLTPLSTWVRSVVNGSQLKYWAQVTATGCSTAPVIGRIYGQSPQASGFATNWGWNPSACISGHINVGTDVEYCAAPAAASSAKFRQQSRAHSNYGQFFLNPSNSQGGRLIGAYLALAAVQGRLNYPAMNGFMFDNVGATPTTGSYFPGYNVANTDFDTVNYANWVVAATAVYQSAHTLITNYYGSSPKFWDGGNVLYPFQTSSFGALDVSMNWTASENFEATNNILNANTAAELWFCNNALWCPGALFGNHNPKNAIMLDLIRANTGIYGLNDGAGSALSNYHLWDESDRDPTMAWASYWSYRTDNVYFDYNSVGFVYLSVGDDYSYFVTSPATAGAVPAAICSTTAPCTISLSASLGTTTCPGLSISACPIRIGKKDVVKVNSYSGTTLTVTSGAIVNSYPSGATIEYVTQGYQSLDNPIHTPVFRWGSWFPSMGENLGTPDSTYGFNYPCNGSFLQASPGCLAVAPLSAKGAASTCNNATNNWCAPVLRRDFSGGPHGYVVVLVRPASYQNHILAPVEYETPGAPYSLPSAMYQLHADGSLTGPVSSATLRGGEAGIFVSH
jgi:hypothetical protein